MESARFSDALGSKCRDEKVSGSLRPRFKAEDILEPGGVSSELVSGTKGIRAL